MNISIPLFYLFQESAVTLHQFFLKIQSRIYTILIHFSLHIVDNQDSTWPFFLILKFKKFNARVFCFVFQIYLAKVKGSYSQVTIGTA